MVNRFEAVASPEGDEDQVVGPTTDYGAVLQIRSEVIPHSHLMKSEAILPPKMWSFVESSVSTTCWLVISVFGVYTLQNYGLGENATAQIFRHSVSVKSLGLEIVLV